MRPIERPWIGLPGTGRRRSYRGGDFDSRNSPAARNRLICSVLNQRLGGLKGQQSLGWDPGTPESLSGSLPSDCGLVPRTLIVDVHVHIGSRRVRRVIGIAWIAKFARRASAAVASVEPFAEHLEGAVGMVLEDPSRIVANRTAHHGLNAEAVPGVPSQARSCFRTSPKARMSVQRSYAGYCTKCSRSSCGFPAARLPMSLARHDARTLGHARRDARTLGRPIVFRPKDASFDAKSSLTIHTGHLPLRLTLIDAVAASTPPAVTVPKRAGRW
jgi:hypothetical protein